MYDLTLTSLLSFLESKSKAAKRRLRKQSAGGGGGGGGVGALFMAAAAIEAAADASPEAGHREKSKKCQKRNADQVASSGSESEGNAAAAAGASDESGSDTNSAADDVQRDEEEEEYEKLEKKDQKKGVVQVATKTPADGVIDVEVEYTFTVTLGFNSANNKASGTALELTPDSPSLKNLPFALGEGISAGDADLVITAGLLGFAKRHPKQAVRKNSNLFGIGVSQTGQIKATVTKAVFDYSETVRWTPHAPAPQGFGYPPHAPAPQGYGYPPHAPAPQGHGHPGGYNSAPPPATPAPELTDAEKDVKIARLKALLDRGVITEAHYNEGVLKYL
jgi:hypothetical protein